MEIKKPSILQIILLCASLVFVMIVGWDIRFIKSSDLLTYSAIMLAFYAYRFSVNSNFDSWKALLSSLQDEMNNVYKYWLSREYFSNKYENKNSYCPDNNIFPLPLESVAEIIRRGVGQVPGATKNFRRYLLLFHERIMAFNSLLDQLKRISAADPVKSEKLINLLVGIGLRNDEVSFKEFQVKINDSKENENNKEIAHLAEYIRRYNRLLHERVIENKKSEMLNFLYSELGVELNTILKNFEKNRPGFVRNFGPIFVFFTFLFLAVELYLCK